MSFIDASTVAQQLTDALSAARHMAYAPVVAAVGDQVADLNDAASAANLLQQEPLRYFGGGIAGTTSQTAAPAALGTFQESDDIDVEDQASLQRCTWWGGDANHQKRRPQPLHCTPLAGSESSPGADTSADFCVQPTTKAKATALLRSWHPSAAVSISTSGMATPA